MTQYLYLHSIAVNFNASKATFNALNLIDLLGNGLLIRL